MRSILTELQARVSVKQRKVADINAHSSSSSSAPQMTMITSIRAHNFHRTVWQQRKRMCMDAVEMIADGMEKKTSKVMQELCLDADEEVGHVMPPVLPEPKK